MHTPSKHSAWTATAALTLFTSLAFGQTPAPAVPDNPREQSEDRAAKKAEAPEIHNDGEIVALVMAIDQNEIDAATAAEQQHLSGPVQDFAKLLGEEHQKDLQDLRTLANQRSLAPKPTPESERLQADGKQQIADLSSKSDADFEKAFISDMQQGHKQALEMLDGCIAKANDEELKRQLVKTREHVETHLRQADILQNGVAALSR